ncbi:hypothetical protein [Geodermatophilus maliterrae]|uniref:Uncharacterized protein n=1 Tax=Geodermatophilus maliterrae TaxID=3162531 RepID=A0ABV3XK30_9ACTN
MTTGEGDEPVVARVTPETGSSVARLLGMPLGLDVWERHADFLVVAAPESRLSELERRRLARVDRWSTAADYVARMQARPPAEDDEEPPEDEGQPV